MKKEKEIILTGKDEMNLAEFPFTVLSHKIAKSKKTIKWTALVLGRNEKLINQEWIVSGSSEFGLPHAIDNDFYLGIMLFLKRNDFKNRTGYFREYEFLKAIGKDDSKRNYQELQQAFARMKGVSIYATNAFWDNKEKCYLKSVGAFGIIDNYWLFSEEKNKDEYDQTALPYSRVTINEVLFQSVQSSYIKTLDLDFYFSLKTPLAKRIFRFLDKNRYRKENFEIDLLKLAHLLPLEDKRTYEIKRKLEKPHKELINKNFLERAEYGKTQIGTHKVIYTFAKIKSLEPEQMEIPLEVPEISISREIRSLIDRGVTEVVAHELVVRYPDRIIKQVEIFDYLLEIKDTKVSKNPAGFLCKSIEKDFASPKGFMTKEERTKIKERQETQRREDAEQRAKEENQIKAERERNAKIDKFIATLPLAEQQALKQRAEQEARKNYGSTFNAMPTIITEKTLREIAIKKYCLTDNKIKKI